MTHRSSIMRIHTLFERFAVASAFLVLAHPLHAQRANGHPDITGVWRMDTTKFLKHDAALTALSLNVTRLGDTLLIITDGVDVGRPPFQMQARYVPEVLARVKAVADTSRRPSVLAWAGDTLVLRTVETRPGRTLSIEERWSIDASGHVLTRVQHVVDETIGRVSQQTLVSTRQ
jgi:hypothetical protein